MAHNDWASACRIDWVEHRRDFRRYLFLEALGGRYRASMKQARSDMRDAAFAYRKARGWW